MTDLDELMAVEEHWPVALEARDRDWLLEHTTATFLCIQPDGLLDRDAYIDHRVDENDSIVDGRNVVVHAAVIGTTGVVVNRAQFLTEDAEGNRHDVRILGSGFYVKDNGVWKVDVMHLTQVAPDATNWGEPLIDTHPRRR